MNRWLEELRANGWVSIPLESDLQNPNEIIHIFFRSVGGSVLKEVETLAPKTQEQARRNTTSAYCGLDVFPCHTDFAHWPTPPRYIVLWSEHGGDTPTQVIPWSSIRLPYATAEKWRQATWRVTRVRRPFVCTMNFNRGNAQAIRWDQYVMEPNDEIARLVKPEISELLEASRKHDSIPIHWQNEKKLLIIDNWRVVHARPVVPQSDLNRRLNRFIVGDRNEQ